jgi:hypothetical protein
MRIVTGIDYLYGRGMARGGDFDYFVDLEGDDPDVSEIEDASHAHITDKRQFAGLYGLFEWFPWESWRFEVGLRLNHTREDRRPRSRKSRPARPRAGRQPHRDPRQRRGGRHLDAVGRRLGRDPRLRELPEHLQAAAIDFGLEAEGDILEPETSESAELGMKTRFATDGWRSTSPPSAWTSRTRS